MAVASAPRLIAITDLGVLPENELIMRLRRLAAAALAGSVALLLRDHQASAQQRLRLGARLREVTRDTGQELWVADRLDLALLLEAEGVHLGEASVSAAAARRLVGARRISRAWHASSVDDVASAELSGVDALLVSPLLAARKGRDALGLAALGVLGEQLRARNQAYLLYGLGGIDPDNAAVCRAAGAFGVAAIGAALGPEPERLLAALGLSR
jgi:thiamine-phosphate pyrophosphorylase